MKKLTEAQQKTSNDFYDLYFNYINLWQQLEEMKDDYAIFEQDPALSGFQQLCGKVDSTLKSLSGYSEILLRHKTSARLKETEKLTVRYMDDILEKQNEEYDSDKAQADYYQECLDYDKYGPKLD